VRGGVGGGALAGRLRLSGVWGGAHSTFVRGGRRYWQCTACRHQCSAISGTVFEATSCRDPLVPGMQLLTQAKNNVAALELRRQLGVCYKTAGW